MLDFTQEQLFIFVIFGVQVAIILILQRKLAVMKRNFEIAAMGLFVLNRYGVPVRALLKRYRLECEELLKDTAKNTPND